MAAKRTDRVAPFLLFLGAVSTGLLSPVLSLMMLDQGLTLSQLAIAKVVYAATVLVLELPSGMACDLFGRKRIYILSHILQIPAFLLICRSGPSLAVSAAGCLCYGASRAFSTGSLEAMAIDAVLEREGKAGLPRISSRLLAAECAGLAAGSLLGGGMLVLLPRLGWAGSIYDGSLWGKVLLSVLIVLITGLWVREDAPAAGERVTLADHLRRSGSVVAGNRVIQGILISTAATGFFLAALETYWQPRLLELLPNQGLLWLTGVLACLYFAFSLGGSTLAEMLMKKGGRALPPMVLYLGCRVLLSGALALLAVQRGLGGFVPLYLISYLMLGSANVAEGVLLGEETPSEVRSSLLSVASLVLQCGALAASALFGWMMRFATIPQVWLLAAGVVGAAALALALRVKKPRSQDGASSCPKAGGAPVGDGR